MSATGPMATARTSALALASVVLLSLAAHPAAAASFDCAKARAPDERAVCANPTLSALDSEMGALWFSYSRFPLLMGASGARRDEAQAFLAARAACGADATCIERAYRARVAVLRKEVAWAIGNLAAQADADPPADPALPQPVSARITAFGPQCRDLGGTPDPASRPQVASADLDRDGRPDYVVDSATLRCEGAATAYCANDGCTVVVALSSAGYAPLDLRGGQPTLALDYKANTLALWVDRTLCDGAAPGDACWGLWRWDGKALKASYAARPR